ncbi:MAG: lysophospholipid acyltransferase family protein [Bacteroidales bacterium]|nr:lysophospholipid acyltransferase family protein [Bacteroidales bacterium]
MSNIGTYILIGIIYLTSLLPHWILYRLSDFNFFFIYYVIGYRKKVVYENLKNSFPEKSHEELKQIEKKFFHHLTDVIMETVKEFSISKRSIKKRFKFMNPEVFQQHYDNGKSVMMTMGHYGNFEYGVSAPLWVPQECWAVYGKIENPVFDKYLVRTRERFGFTLFPMEETYNVMLKHKQGDKLYMFMADQSPHHAKIKYWLPFLNQETPVHKGAEKLSKMMDLAVVFIDIQKVKRGYYEITAHTLYDNPKETSENEITDKYFEILEKVIQKNPEYWLWSHKRWKYKRGVKY